MRAKLFLAALLLALGPSLCAKNKLSSSRSHSIDQLLAVRVGQGLPGMAVLVRRGDEVLFRQGYGLASLGEKKPLIPSTPFRVGSITKQFTAFAILLLVQENKISLADPLELYLPDFSGQNIQIEHLLTHTSGLTNYVGIAYGPRWVQSRNSKEVVRALIASAPLEFRPGEKWSYCDSGYFLLGLVIEKVTGESYETFISSRILRPLGMLRSYFDTDSKELAGYRWDGYAFARARPLNENISYSAGSLITTIDDLARWDKALYSSPLLRPDLLARMFAPYRLNGGQTIFYGYGWFVHDFLGYRLVEHGGRIDGFEGHILRIPQQNLLVVILSNAEGHEPSPDFLATQIAKIVLGIRLESVAISLPLTIRQEIVGTYFVSAGDFRCVTIEGAKTFTARNQSEPREIYASSKDEFYYRQSLSTIKFIRNPFGHISGMMMATKYGKSFSPRISTDTAACDPGRAP